MMPSPWASTGVASMKKANVAASFLSVLVNMGDLRVMDIELEPRGEQRGCDERRADAGDAGVPAEAVVDLAEQRRANEPTQEVAREVEATRGTAIGGGGAADKAGRDRLR